MDFMDLFGGGQESELRQGFDTACRERDLNLLIAFGLPLDSPHPWGAAHNAVYRLMAADCVDGLIVLSSSLATYSDHESIRRLCEQYGTRPLCSVGLAVPGVPSILVDHRSGMEAVVAHLVSDHDCRRLSFVGGPAETPDDKIQFEFFRDALQRHGLSCDSELIANAEFVRYSGQDAMDQILDRGAKPDAVVVANEGMALGVISALRRRGFRLPHDVRVTAFGSLSTGRLMNPLTTVGQPFRTMADRAIALLVDQFAGRSVPDCTYVPAQLVRGFWGCNCCTRQLPGPDALGQATSFLRAHAGHIRRVLADRLGQCDADAADEARMLVDALQAELEGQTESFPTAFEALLSKVADRHERYQAFQGAITVLRRELRHVGTLELEDLWHEARSLITVATTRHHAEQRSRIDDACRGWVDTQDLLSSAIDPPDFGRALAKGLRASGVQSAFVSQYLRNQQSALEPLFCMIDGLPRQPAESQYPTGQLFPTDGYPTGRRHTSLVFPLAFEAQPLGVAVFEYAAEVSGYEVLGRQISAALENVALHEEVVRRKTLHERSVLECVVELMIDRGLCLKQNRWLVFPTLFPDTAQVEEVKAEDRVSLYYDFSGAIDNVYSALVAHLALSERFGRVRLWKNRAEFERPGQGVCGLRRMDRQGGWSHLDLFFGQGVSDETRHLFTLFVEEHLQDHGVDIREVLEVQCVGCAHVFEESVVRERIHRSHSDVLCPICETRSAIIKGAVTLREEGPGLTQELVALRRTIELEKQRDIREAKRALKPTATENRKTGREGESPPIRLLHLSDLHFSKQDDLIARLQPLLSDLGDPTFGFGQKAINFLA